MSYCKKYQLQQPQTEQVKLKINNSYESEPSSGSGSSLSEHNDCNASDDENLRLPYLLNPIPMSATKNTKHDLHSSQESPFLGFGDSPVNKLQQKIYKESPITPLPCAKAASSSQESSFAGFSSSSEHKQQRPIKNIEIPAAKAVFSLFYDFLIENSCNAVDIELPHANAVPKEVEMRKTAEQDLSFNGKIRNLCENLKQNHIEKQTDTLLENSLTQTEKSFTSKCQKSPDLFNDDEETNLDSDNEDTNVDLDAEDFIAEDAITMLPQALSTLTANRTSLNNAQFLNWNKQCEVELLRRTRICLNGVPPPPSHTLPEFNMFEEVKKHKQHILNFFDEIKACKQKNEMNATGSGISGSLFKPTHTLQETQSMPWQHILAVRQHGLSYNLSKASEDYEYLSLSVIQRFIGAETTSSYCVEPSSDKKRKSRLKMLPQSPGNRLSHLAKRRSVFSSANLANTSQKGVGKQILVDRIKIKARRRCTPKRDTPKSKKKRKTPSSSARKRLYRCDLNKPGPTRETSKRALFQSPAKQNKLEELRAPLTRPLQIKPEIATRLEKSKRALFSPDKSADSQSSLGFDRILKRKRQDSENDDAMITQSSKFFRGSMETITPRSLKIKSQSFCMGAFPATSSTTRPDTISNTAHTNFGQVSSSERDSNKHLLHRAQSELILQSQSLTENQRKKLLWAVSQALQERKIAVKHEKFKDYASVLARVVRRIFQEFYQKSSTSNSETLLRLSKKYVFHVIAGRQADDIYRQAKVHIEESARLSRTRFSGYIGPEEYAQRKLAAEQDLVTIKTSSMQNLYITDNSMDSCSVSWSCANDAEMSQSLYSGSSFAAAPTPDSQFSFSQGSAAKNPITANPSLQNSSSKNNMGAVLRENALDAGEQRRSAQKSSAKKSMLNQLLSTDCNKPTQLLNNLNFNSARAKRNISFDI